MKPIAWIIAGLGLATLVVAIVFVKDFRLTLGASAFFAFPALISRGQSTVHVPVLRGRPAQALPVERTQARGKSA